MSIIRTIIQARRLAAGVLALVVMAALIVPGVAFAEGDLVAGTTEGEESATATTEGESLAPAETVKPKYAKVKKIKLSKKRVRIINDGIVKLEAKLVPDVKGLPIKNTKLTWRVSNKKIASVTQEGEVRGKRAGTVTVTVKAKNGVKATAKVKVTIQKSKMATAIPVLTYHRIASDTAKRAVYGDSNLAISASRFESQMRWLVNNGYHTISTEEFKDWRLNGTFLPKKCVLITMDDGFYEVYHVAYPILKKYNLKATSFAIGAYVGKKTHEYNPYNTSNHYVGWDAIKKVRKKYPNLEFQSHTYNMHHRASSGMGVVTSRSYESIMTDFECNEKFGFTSIAYPFGHTSSNMYKALRNYKPVGIAFGYMMTWPATRNSPRYNIPRFKVFGDRGLDDFISIVSTAR